MTRGDDTQNWYAILISLIRYGTIIKRDTDTTPRPVKVSATRLPRARFLYQLRVSRIQKWINRKHTKIPQYLQSKICISGPRLQNIVQKYNTYCRQFDTRSGKKSGEKAKCPQIIKGLGTMVHDTWWWDTELRYAAVKYITWAQL